MNNYSVITIAELAEMLYKESGELTRPTGYIDFSLMLNDPDGDSNITNRGISLQYLFGDLCLITGKWGGGYFTTSYNVTSHHIKDVQSIIDILKEDFEFLLDYYDYYRPCKADTKVIINSLTLWHNGVSVLKEAV